MSGHTPLPWRFVAGKIVSGANERRGKIADVAIAYKGSVERDANAELIVRACNSHYDLLEALEVMLIFYATAEQKGEVSELVHNKARGALAKAQVQP